MPKAHLSSHFDPPPVVAGATYKFPIPGKSTPHLWIVLTDPDDNDKLAVVNLTTRRTGSDETVILRPGDHPFVKHPTIVNYGDADFAIAGKLTNAVSRGVAWSHSPVNQDVLSRIQNGVQQSRHTPRELKEYVRRRLE